MTDALVFGTFDQIPTTVDLEQSATPSSSASTLPPQETDTINWMEFSDFNGLSPHNASFDPMLVPAPLHHPVHTTDDSSEQALLSSLGAFFAPLDHHQQHLHNHHQHQHHQNAHAMHSPTHSSPHGQQHPMHSSVFRMPTETRTAVKQQEPLIAKQLEPSFILPTTLPTDLSLLLPAPTSTSPNPAFMRDDDKWQAVLTRDPAADAAFVYCVTSTRIYCRPTCASRRPLRANTVYADTPAEAELLGYRACRRCLPHCLASASEMRQVLAVEQAKVVIHECVRDGRPAPSLSVLAQHVGMSKFHLQRTFKRLVGHSPDAHAKALAKAWRGVGRG